MMNTTPVKKRSLQIALACTILATGVTIHANTLFFDATFGNGGFVNQTLNINAACAGVVVSGTNIIVAGTTELSSGTSNIFLARYTSAGVLDTTFGTNGYATISNYNAQAALLSVNNAGSLLVSGVANIAGVNQIIVAQFTSAGLLDGTFGTGGIVTTTVPGSTSSASFAAFYDQNQQPVIAGSAVINGISTSVVIRYNTNGSLDGTFGTGGIFTTTIGSGSSAQALVLDASNNILVGGYSIDSTTTRTKFALFRLTTAGTLDGTFGSGGIVTTVVPGSTHDVIVGIGVQSSGSIVVAGNSQLSNNLSQITLARYTSSGILDTTFGSSGFVAYAPGNFNGATSMLVQAVNSPINSIVLAGQSDNQFLLARFTSTGAVDTTFGVNGTVQTALNSIAINNALAIQTSDGKIVVAGASISQDQTNQNYTINRNLANNNDITITNVANTQVGYTATPTLTGNVAPIFSGVGLVQLILDGTTLSSTVPIASDGSWSYVVSTAQSNGPHTLVANLLNPGIVASVTSNFAICTTTSPISSLASINLIHTQPTNNSGVIIKSAIRFMHDYSATSNLTNLFLGSASGNFTATSNAIQNTALGAASMQNLSSGNDNIAIGYQALQANSFGSQNIAVGSGALQNNLTSQNTAIGYQALQTNTTGAPNMAIGYRSLTTNTTGTNNIAIGSQTLQINASGTNNIAIGNQSLQNNQANNNIAIGLQALQSNTLGFSNICIGVNNNKLSTTGQFNLVIGNVLFGSNITGSFNTVMGAQIANAGQPSFCTSIGALTLSGSGSIANNYLNAIGSRALSSLSSGSFNTANTAIGYRASASIRTGAKNVSIGASSLQGAGLVTLQNNTAIGYQAFVGLNNNSSDNISIGANTSGSGVFTKIVACGNNSLAHNASGSNTAIGCNTLNANTIGETNTALGINSLLANTTGIANTAIGDNALNKLASGIGNVAIGSNALLNNASGSNTIIGYNAMTASGTGGLNTAIGIQSLTLNASISNTALGENTLTKNTLGGSNTAIGARALNNLASGSSNFAAGLTAGSNYNARETSNILLANAGTAGENSSIRIGTNGTHAATFIAGIRGITTVNNDAAQVLIDSAGQLGTVNSSVRFKENIASMDDSIVDKLAQLNPVSFTYKADAGQKLQWGLIAEQVKEVMPQLVVDDAQANAFTVRYHILPTLLLKGWQDSRNKLAAIESTAREHQLRIDQLYGRHRR